VQQTHIVVSAAYTPFGKELKENLVQQGLVTEMPLPSALDVFGGLQSTSIQEVR